MFLNFRVIYFVIYEFFYFENGFVIYFLDKVGNIRYEEFIDGIFVFLNSQWVRNICLEDVFKDDRYVLWLVVVLYVFYD